MPWAQHWQAGLLGSYWAPSSTPQVSRFGGSAAVGKAMPKWALPSAWCVEKNPKDSGQSWASLLGH